jgi:hypothetical protein
MSDFMHIRISTLRSIHVGKGHIIRKIVMFQTITIFLALLGFSPAQASGTDTSTVSIQVNIDRATDCIFWYSLLDVYLNKALDIKNGLGVKQEFEKDLLALGNGMTLSISSLSRTKDTDSIIYRNVTKKSVVNRLKIERDYFLKSRVRLVEKNQLDVEGVIQHLKSLKAFGKPVCISKS